MVYDARDLDAAVVRGVMDELADVATWADVAVTLADVAWLIGAVLGVLFAVGFAFWETRRRRSRPDEEKRYPAPWQQPWDPES